jgi:putative redox protein
VDITITFPGGKKVSAEMNGMIIPTDQPKKLGGDDTAPSPYALFLASIGTCAGIYVLSFCQERKISTDAISLSQRLEYAATAEGKSKLSKILIDIRVPPDFPEKYHAALVRVAEQCAVKKTIQDPPQFEVRTIVGN